MPLIDSPTGTDTTFAYNDTRGPDLDGRWHGDSGAVADRADDVCWAAVRKFHWSVRLKRVQIGPECYMDVDLEDGAGQWICDLDELHVPRRDLRFCASEVGRETGIALEFQSLAARSGNSALPRPFDGH